uniref:Secreted protein n=1 Tax=Heterorhabditis bacteriophora TaxID=37862 RepID=A0A1I7WYY5_HETBA
MLTYTSLLSCFTMVHGCAAFQFQSWCFVLCCMAILDVNNANGHIHVHNCDVTDVIVSL